jgi:hypothetical protein
VGGGVQLGTLGTAATNRATVPALGDYDDGEIGGMMIGRGNQSTWRKPAPVPLCPPQTPHAYPDVNRGRHGGKPATNCLSYGTAIHSITNTSVTQDKHYVSQNLSHWCKMYKDAGGGRF